MNGKRQRAGRAVQVGLVAVGQPNGVPDAAAATPVELEHPDSALVREQLERILDSNEFIGSDRTRRFLRYIVEETLAGRGDRIKAFSVALAAFDRDESFDPQTDPIVRIEAGRLRRSLERYYFVASAADRVRIEVPKGTYVPVFSFFNAPVDLGAPSLPKLPRDGPPAPRLATLIKAPRMIGALAGTLALIVGLAVVVTSTDTDEPAVEGSRPVLPDPSVVVLPFGPSGPEAFVARLSSGMTNEVIRELSRYSSVFVLGPQAIQRFGASPDITVVGATAGVDFVLSGGIQQGAGRIRVSVQLSETETGGIVWAETYDRDFVVERVFDLQVEIARDIVRKIGQPQGAIAHFDWKRTRGKAPEAWEAYDCVLQADDLRRRVLPPALAPEIRACLTRAVEAEPGYADAWMMLAFIDIDEARFAPSAESSTESLNLAYAAASQAVDLAPDSGRAQLALMLALFLRGDVEEALAVGQGAMQLSPHDPDIMAEVGLRNVVAGDVNTGMRLVEQALDQYQTVPVSYRVALPLGYLRQGFYQQAVDSLGALVRTPNYVYWSIVAAVHGKAGDLDKAREAAAELLRLYPDFPNRAWTEIERRSVAPELGVALVEGWRAAGLEIPPAPSATTAPQQPGL